MKRLWFFLAIVFCLTQLSFGQDAAQSTAQNNMHVDPWHSFTVGAAFDATDSLRVVYGGNDHTDPFKHWEVQVVHMFVIGADSIKFFVDHMQYAYAPSATAADTGKFCKIQTLSWSNPDTTSIDTIEANGHYIAKINTSITDTSCFPALWDMLKARPITGNTKKAGNNVKFVILGREAVTKQETWRR